MKNLLKLLTISLFVTLTSCVNDETYDSPDLSGECTDLTSTKQVSFFSTSAPVLSQGDVPPVHPDNDIIEVVVTATGTPTLKLFVRLVATQ